MSKPNRILALAGASLTWLLSTTAAVAWPNSVVFTPTGEAKAGGQGGLIVYTAPYAGNPAAWVCCNLGLLPSLPYGNSGLSFGGLEVGLDAIALNGMNPGFKPIFNAKAQLLVETGALPSLAVGTLANALTVPSRSLNLAYASATKSLDWGTVGLGRLTLGLGKPLASSPDLYQPAGWSTDSAALLAGYEFPAWGPFSLAVDHIGGISEIGGTNVALNWQMTPGNYAGLGYAFGNDRSVAGGDSVFFYLANNWTAWH